MTATAEKARKMQNAPGDQLFSIDGVSYTYGGRTALSDVSLSIARGESVALLGANGSGKSTLLKLLDGLIFPASGTVSYMGTTLTPAALGGAFLREFRRSVAMVFSEPDVQLFNPTVFDELSFGPLQLGLDANTVRERVEDILELTGTAALRDRAPYELSAGEKKKVAIASVLAVDPEVLLLDEPTSTLDPGSQVWLLELIGALKGLGRTFVISTHDLSLASDLCERTVVIDESHGIAADKDTAGVLSDIEMLLGANIIHKHSHRHGSWTHVHSHAPYAPHDMHD